METLFAGVALALLSALGWMAYQHPKGYAKLYVPLTLISSLVIVAVASWDVGYGWGVEDVRQAASKVTQTLLGEFRSPAELRYLLIGLGLLNFYLIFLAYLPRILDLKSE